LIVGFSDPRRKLKVNPPEIVEAYYLCLIAVRANSQDGQSHDLFADRMYVVKLTPSPWEENRATYLSAKSCSDVRPDDFLSSLLGASVKSYRESVAYQRGLLCESLPLEFRPDDITNYLYFGDFDSPFRHRERATGASAGTRWTRSNFAGFLSVLRTAGPPISPLIDAQVGELAGMADHALSVKARYIQDALNPTFEKPILPIASSIRVRSIAP
jgi:hypothetical protein